MNPERLNIKDLTIKEPEKLEPVFDVQEELTDRDWKLMMHELKNVRGKHFASLFAQLAADMKILDPDKDLRLEEEDFGMLYRNLEKSAEDGKEHNFWSPYLRLAGNTKLLYPNRGIPMDNKIIEGVKNTLDGFKEAGNWKEFIHAASAAKVLMPSLDLNLVKEDWEQILKLFGGPDGPHWQNKIEAAREVSIIMQAVNFNVDDNLWKKFQGGLESFRGGAGGERQWESFAYYASSMKILTAKDINIPPEGGLQLTMEEKPKNEEEKVESFPEKRNF